MTRHLFVGVDLDGLADAVDEAQAPFRDEPGVDPTDPEEHRFTPHATTARMRDARRKEHVQAVVRERDPDVGDLRVEAVRLTESTLTPDGPEYETVAAFGL